MTRKFCSKCGAAREYSYQKLCTSCGAAFTEPAIGSMSPAARPAVSPGHRENILTQRDPLEGIGVAL